MTGRFNCRTAGLLVLAVLCVVRPGFAVTEETKCKDAKARAVGRKAAAVLRAVGKNLRKPAPTRLAQDVSKARSKFTRSIAKAEARGGCLTVGDAAALEARVDAFSADTVGEIDPATSTCGNGVVDDDEECDGADAGACAPARCQPDCACNACGNETLDPGEQCDGADAAACPGLCQPNCVCPEPACGNGVLEVGEECDARCEQGPCAASEVCGVACTCVPVVPCACGTPGPPLTLEYTVEPQGGICGAVKDAGGTTLLDLECARNYVGGGILGAAPPATTAPFGMNVAGVACCNGTELVIENTTAAETGSIRSCTSAGCLQGAPVPTISSPTILSVCTVDRIVADVVGSAECTTGEVKLEVPVVAPVFLTGDLLPQRCSAGSATPGAGCTDDSGCPGGACDADPDVQPCPICNPVTLTCNGGPNSGLPCTPGNAAIGPEYPTSHDCPSDPLLEISMSLQPFSLTTGTGTMSAPDGQFCGFCRDVLDEGSFCFDGDEDPSGARGCPDSSILACAPASDGDVSGCGKALACDSDADCFAPYETCQQRDAGASNNPTATTVTETGAPGGSLADRAAHPVTLVSTYCVPPTFDDLTDSQADFPGPGATAWPGSVQLRP